MARQPYHPGTRNRAPPFPTSLYGHPLLNTRPQGIDAKALCLREWVAG